MKSTKFILLFLLFTIPFNIYSIHKVDSIKIPEGISIAIKAGNAKELANFFNSTIELVILEKEDVYSKPQAEQILKDFFKNYKPVNFLILHKGGKEVTTYAIGNLTTTDIVFRVYFLLKKKNDNPLIYQLRIEEEEIDEK